VADARSERHPSVRSGGSGGGSHVEERRRSNFIAESWAELKKVEWPGQNQVIQGTVVVLVACLVVGAYLYVNDQVWKQVVSKVFLGQ
jgi:preprotein translocase subunit SecE